MLSVLVIECLMCSGCFVYVCISVVFWWLFKAALLCFVCCCLLLVDCWLVRGLLGSWVACFAVSSVVLMLWW